MNPLLVELAKLNGLILSYRDPQDKLIDIPEENVLAFFEANEIPVGTDAEIQKSILNRRKWMLSKVVEPVYGLDEQLGRLEIVATLPENSGVAHYYVRAGEDVVSRGTVRPAKEARTKLADGTVFEHFDIELTDLERGFRDRVVDFFDANNAVIASAPTRVIVGPNNYWQPPEGKRPIVVTTMISSLTSTSPKYLGRGNFGTMIAGLQEVAESGADMFAPGPLFMFDWPLDQTSGTPFMPITRLLFDHHVLDPSFLCSKLDLKVSAAFLESRAMQVKFAKCRLGGEMNLYDYDRALLDVLRQMSSEFFPKHVQGDTNAGRDYLQFVAKHRDTFEDPALFIALRNHIFPVGSSPGNRDWDWHEWADHFREPDDAQIAALKTQFADEIRFILFLQYLTHLNLTEANRVAADIGVSSLMLNMPVGVSAAAAETWLYKRLYFKRIRNGAPADNLEPRGQSWNYPMMNPDILLERGLRDIIEPIALLGPYADGLEDDHGMKWDRMWAYVEGKEAKDGLYIRYPLELILRAVALLSHQHQFFVAPELVGTKSDYIDKRMEDVGALSLTQQRFEVRKDGSPKSSDEYSEKILLFGNCHNHFPDFSWLCGFDLEMGWKHRGDEPPAVKAAARAKRRIEALYYLQMLDYEGVLATEDRQLIEALVDDLNGTWIEIQNLNPVEKARRPIERVLANLAAEPSAQAFNIASHRSRARSKALAIGIEVGEAMLDSMTANMPGQTPNYPSWLRKLPPVESWKNGLLGDVIRATKKELTLTRKSA